MTQQPVQPSASSTRPEPDADALQPDTLIVIQSERSEEPWCLAKVCGDVEDPSHVAIHYYNRSNTGSPPDRWVWRPAYVDPKDKVDVLTYRPRGRLQPYLRTIPRSMVLVPDVRLTKAGCICAADLKRIGVCPRVTWSYRTGVKRVAKPPLGVGVKVAKRFGRHGVFVGRVVSIRSHGDKPLYKVVYTDGDSEEFSKYQLKKYMQRHHTAFGHGPDAPAEPSRSLLQSKRLRRAVQRRPSRSTQAQRAAASARRR